MKLSINHTSGIIGLINLLAPAIIEKHFLGDGKVRPDNIRKFLIYVPSAFTIIINFADFGITDVIIWLYYNTGKYAAIIIALVILEPIGGIVDSIIALCTYQNRNEIAHVSWDKIKKIIKYGDYNQVILGRGRYDISLRHIIYGFLSNLTGAMCPLSMMLFIKTLPNFLSYISGAELFDYFGMCAPFTIIPAIQQIAAQQNKQIPNSVDSLKENPDNYLLNRFHTLFSFVCLWSTISMVIVLGFIYFSYAISNFRKYDINIWLLLPIAALTVFLLYQSYSESSYEYKAVNTRAYQFGILIISIIVTSSLVLFKMSLITFLIAVFSALLLASWWWMIRRINLKIASDTEWKEETKWICALPLLMIISVVIIIFVQTTIWLSS